MAEIRKINPVRGARQALRVLAEEVEGRGHAAAPILADHEDVEAELRHAEPEFQRLPRAPMRGEIEDARRLIAGRSGRNRECRRADLVGAEPLDAHAAVRVPRALSRVSIASQTCFSSCFPSSRLISWMPVGEVTLISVRHSPITSMPTKIRP